MSTTEYDDDEGVVTVDEGQSERDEVIVMPEKMEKKSSGSRKKVLRGSCWQRFVRNLLFVFGTFIFIVGLIVVLSAFLLGENNEQLNDVLTKISNNSYVFETLTYKYYIIEFSYSAVMVTILGFFIVILGLFSSIQLSEKKFLKQALVLFAIVGACFLLVSYLKINNNLSVKVFKNIEDEFTKVFIENFKTGTTYFDSLKTFMATKECCGPSGMTKFKKSVPTYHQFAPEFCYNNTRKEYERGCYDVFKYMNTKTVDYIVPFILGGSAIIALFFILLYFCSFSTNGEFSKKNLANARDKLKKAIKKRIKRKS